MDERALKIYLDKKLKELGQQKDMQEIFSKGKMSFGIDSRQYGHLPGWSTLLQQKKRMIRNIWINAFFLSFMIVTVLNNPMEKMEQNWIRGLAGWILLSFIIMLFYVVWCYHNIFTEFRKTEREVRKLIYEDIIFQIEKISQEEKATS